MEEKTFNLRLSALEIVSRFLAPQPIRQTETGIQEVTRDYNINFLVDVRLAQDKKMALVVTDVTISEKDNNNKLADLKTLCAFDLPDFEKIFVKLEENKFSMPIELEIILKSLGLTTTRGMLFCELRGTYLHGAILPLVDMDTLVRNQHKAMQTLAPAH